MFALMKRLSTTVRQLAERHARLKGEVAKLDDILADIARSREQLLAKADATAVLLTSFDERIEAARIAPVEAYKGRYGEHGALKSAILEHVRVASPDGISVPLLTRLLRADFGLEFLTRTKEQAWVVSSVWPQLRRLAEQDILEKFKLGPHRNDLTYWRVKAAAGGEPTLEDLFRQAGAEGLSVSEA